MVEGRRLDLGTGEPMTLRVLHVVGSYYPAFAYGGPIRSVHALCRHLVRAGVEVDVATTDANADSRLDVPKGVPLSVDGVRVRYFAALLPRSVILSPQQGRFLGES